MHYRIWCTFEYFALSAPFSKEPDIDKAQRLDHVEIYKENKSRRGLVEGVGGGSGEGGEGDDNSNIMEKDNVINHRSIYIIIIF
jgi:hypothetical protein